MDRRIAIVVAVNDDQVLSANLLASDLVHHGAIPVFQQRGYSSAGKAYNAGLAQIDATQAADVVIFAHQDVYFPRGWDRRLRAAMAQLEARGQKWAVLGVWGVQADGQLRGRVWCSASKCEFCGAGVRPVDWAADSGARPPSSAHGQADAQSDAIGLWPVESIDEIVIVLNRSAGLRFDENLPGFHLYATDLALQARQRGFGTFVLDAPAVHNSRPAPWLYESFAVPYRYMQRKWAGQLPVRTCVVPITRFGWKLHKHRAKAALNAILGRVPTHRRLDSPRPIARQLGYEC